jgi:aspartyl-tRNA synthetase
MTPYFCFACIELHDCNSLRKTDVGQQVTLAGCARVARSRGVIFIDLRDREGLTQVVFRPEENAEVARQSHSLRSEDVIQVTGKVAPRIVGTENPACHRRYCGSGVADPESGGGFAVPADTEVHNEDA